MSDTTPIDNAADNAATSTPVAPPSEAGDTPGSTPASVDATASPAKEGEEAKPSRSESRRQASQRREFRDLQRQLGYSQAQIEALRAQLNPEQAQPQEKLSPAEAAAERRLIALAQIARERLEDAGDEVEGLDEAYKTISAKGFPMTAAIVEFLSDSEQAPEMAMWLAKNPERAKRIALMSDWRADRELEKVAAGLTDKPAPRTTNTPPPPPTVSGRGTPQVSLENASMEDFVKIREQQRAKAGYR